jgi:hypothetical protein
MKIKSLFLSLIVSFSITVSSIAQVSFCSDFIVNGIMEDTVPYGVLVSIYFHAPIENFVTNPMVELIINCDGDIVGTGEPFWYMHNGGTTKHYPVGLFGDLCYPLTIIFSFDEISEPLCKLVYEGPTSIEETKEVNVFLYPNPAQDEIRIQSDVSIVGEEYYIYNSLGGLVDSNKITSDNMSLNIIDFPTGIYYFVVGRKTIKVIKN